jgi:hypothetical protein
MIGLILFVSPVMLLGLVLGWLSIKAEIEREQ